MSAATIGPENGSTPTHDARDGRLLTAAEVAERLGVSERYVWRLGRNRDLPRIKFGKYVRFALADVEAFVAERRRGPEIPRTNHVEPRPRLNNRPRSMAGRRRF